MSAPSRCLIAGCDAQLDYRNRSGLCIEHRAPDGAPEYIAYETRDRDLASPAWQATRTANQALAATQSIEIAKKATP